MSEALKMNITRKELVEHDATMNQSRNMIYHLIRFMKVNGVDGENVKERLREMGRNIARTYINYWNPIEQVDTVNIRDVITTMYKKILNSSVSVEMDESQKLIVVRDSKCALCKYFYEDVGNFAGCEVILGMISELVSLINGGSASGSKILLTPVDDLELSVRSHNCLKAADIKSLGDLVRKDEAEMLKFRNFGRKSLAELMEIVENLGLDFGMDVDKYLKEEPETS